MLSNNSDVFLSWLKPYMQQALVVRQRRLVVLAGETAWALSLLKALPSSPAEKPANVQGENKADWLIYSDFLDALPPFNQQAVNSTAVDRKSYRHHLGTENTYLLFDGGKSDDDFNIDALAALSGTLVAGGVLFLLWPQGKVSSAVAKSIFLQRFCRELVHDHAACFLEQGKALPSLPAEPGFEPPAQESLALGCKTPEQVAAVQNIFKVVKGHRNRPLVLTADRGRGKSSALAIAAAELLAQHDSGGEKMHIGVTAPHLQACDVFFQQLKTSLPGAKFSRGRCEYANGVLEFLPVDVLVQRKPKLGLLLVDEAAAIPVYLLQKLLHSYHRMVFSTTVHGYEGAGRGFTLKFLKILKQHSRQYQAFHLHQPIRWAQDDPLESFIFKACLLKAALADINDNRLPFPESLLARQGEYKAEFLQLTPEDLLADEALLEQIFAVLVTAHYQTKPGDLKMLLDNARLRIFCLKSQQQVIAVALLMLEGKAGAEDIDAVKNSRRRLRDQFIPQSLLSHNGVDNAFEHSYLRIMRIAVHPMCQQKGLGSYFLTCLEQYGQAQQIDFIGSSFGANTRLLSFWLEGDYQLARMGFTPDAASGEHSALVLKTLNPDSGALQQEIRQQFYRSFDYLLLEEYQNLPVDLVALILRYCPRAALAGLSDFDRRTVAAFAAQQRLYSSCVYSLHLWLKSLLAKTAATTSVKAKAQAKEKKAPTTTEQALYPLISRILCKHSISQVCHQYGFTGKKALNQYLISQVQQALNQEGLSGD
ncbi:tRNA(Met) cytidine acetyltransferase TmcA [Thalassomonas haliotis]|uniref:tRNA(Met) cytidine acetyltransferase TmcA n=1 Tax=Thalassomonas haliotis TaxID=485448 RepID=A0ABY7VH22_9GAMM|nr:GNAT family N-acetyltransferase [Thalassomonas haliotis]WDE12768.1 tRNA(Met) cytidine acetyltransferase [Thalassomonas haliotis]